MLTLLKRLFLGLLSVVVVVVIIGLLFLNISPQFGGKATDAERMAYAETGHFENGVFTNPEVINMELDCHSVQQMLKETLQPDPHVAPEKEIMVKKVAANTFRNRPDSLVRLTWFGHSTFLIEIEGKNILLDPVFGQYAAPHPWLGRKRYHSEMPISIADLPAIDAVIISHDHYDHLDYESIVQLKDKTDHFFVPLGVDNHLERWQIPDDKITKMDWWDEVSFDSLTIAFTPSRHMSGRRLNDQYATLWGSWVFKGKARSIFFSGDGGYGKHFKDIGEKYGAFDVALMECGQYNVLWADVHLMPEQTVAAAKDVNAELIVPIHWGAFTLATHSWTEPVERAIKEAKKQRMPIATPEIGEPIVLGHPEMPHRTWWEDYQ